MLEPSKRKMSAKKIVLLFCFLVIKTLAFPKSVELANYLISERKVSSPNIRETDLEISIDDIFDNRPNPLFQLFKVKHKKNKRITAAILAFPFPFGMVGLHRIYLGCAPYIPVVYIATVGGAFFILPLIDFCVLLANKDLEKFSNNKKVFMWVD